MVEMMVVPIAMTAMKINAIKNANDQRAPRTNDLPDSPSLRIPFRFDFIASSRLSLAISVFKCNS